MMLQLLQHTPTIWITNYTNVQAQLTLDSTTSIIAKQSTLRCNTRSMNTRYDQQNHLEIMTKCTLVTRLDTMTVRRTLQV